MTNVELPAIAGGEPIKKTPYGKEKRYGEEELRELTEALEQDTLFYAQGQKVKALETSFGRMNDIDYAIACTSGTASLHCAMIAIGISPGDEVITTPITDMGTLIAILYQGAIPIFADLDPRTYTITPESVAAKMTDKTRAVVAVHLAGNACDINALKRLCEERGVTLVEDCAQAFGCVYGGRPIGTWGEIGCFSLNEFKHISCGDGGLVITRNSSLAERLRLATDKGYNRQPDILMRDPKFLANNYRMTELQGAVALAQLGKLDGIVERRRRWCSALTEKLSDIAGLLLPQPTPGCDPSWWFYMMRVVPSILCADATTFADAVQKEGVPVGAHYIGRCVYEYPIFQERSAFARGAHACASYEYTKGMCPVAEEILDTTVILRVNQAYTDADLDETALAFHRVADWFRRKGG